MTLLEAFEADHRAFLTLTQAAAELPGFDGEPDDGLRSHVDEPNDYSGLPSEEHLVQARWRLRRRLIRVAEAVEATAMARLRRLTDEHAAWWAELPGGLVLPDGELVSLGDVEQGPEASFAAMWPDELTRALALHGRVTELAARVVGDLAGQIWAVAQTGVFATGRVGLGNLHEQIASLMILPTGHLERKAPQMLRELVEAVEFHLYHEVTAVLDDVSGRRFPVQARVLVDLRATRTHLLALGGVAPAAPG